MGEKKKPRPGATCTVHVAACDPVGLGVRREWLTKPEWVRPVQLCLLPEDIRLLVVLALRASDSRNVFQSALLQRQGDIVTVDVVRLHALAGLPGLPKGSALAARIERLITLGALLVAPADVEAASGAVLEVNAAIHTWLISEKSKTS